MKDQAEIEEKRGNIENAYIFLGRYMNLLTQMQKHKDYEKNKDFIKAMMGGNSQQMALMAKLGKLQNEIIERLKKQSPAAKTVNEVLPTQQKQEILTAEKTVEESETITCEKLYEMIEKDSSKFIIMDCRTSDDFEESRIDFKFMCNVPQELCCIGMSAEKIGKKIPNSSMVFWQMRKNRQILVFVDWSSTKFGRNTPVWTLRNIFRDFDQDINESIVILLLEGGYDRWLIKYPMKCTDPHVKRPEIINSSPDIDGIEYPNLEDITMKDDKSFSSANNSKTPQVDRSTKGSAIKAYEKNLSESDLLQEKEDLINKSIKNEKELLKLEQDLETISGNKENEADPVKEQQTMYAIWELDTKQKDFAIQHESINKELEKVKKTEVSSPFKSKVEDLEYRLKKKEAEEKELHENVARKRKEREEKLKIARLHKPVLDDYKSPTKAPRKSEVILSPKTLNQNVIPHFDRASKPTLFTNSQNFYDNQDFAPVYQKVVSVMSLLITISCVLSRVSCSISKNIPTYALIWH